MKLTPSFVNLLKQKLTMANSRSILLNAIPGRLTSRLPLTDFNLIKNGLSKLFLDTLMSQKDFNFKITINFTGRTDEEQGKLSRVGKRVSSIKFDHDDYLKEHGVETFGFGFPVLIRQNPNDASKTVAAPIFIFPLDIKQSFDKPNEWIISRNSESEIRINEVLVSYLENEEHLKLPTIPDEMLDDGVLDENEIKTLCSELISMFYETDIVVNDLNWSEFEEFPDKLISALKNKTEQAKILWNGVFGIFKSQKQNLIKEIDTLISNFDDVFNAAEAEFDWENSHSPMTTDPSQNGVLRSLGESKNIVIQGPPGTGKSQTLTAIVTSALANKKKILVVCEKRTALEVLKSNLEKLIPESKMAIALIEDVAKDRSAIVETVRARTAALLSNNHHLQNMLRVDIDNFEKKAEQIDTQYNALKIPIWNNKAWPGMVSKWINSQKQEKEKQSLYKLQKLFQINQTTDEAYLALRITIEDAARIFGKAKLEYDKLQSSIKLPNDFSNNYNRDIIHIAKDSYNEIDSVLLSFEKLKKEIKANTTSEIKNKIDQSISYLKELNIIVSNAKNKNVDVFQLPMKVKILSIFNSKWKAIVRSAGQARNLHSQLDVFWSEIINMPFVVDELQLKQEYLLSQQNNIIEDKFIQRVKTNSISQYLNPEYVAIYNDCISKLELIDSNLQSIFKSISFSLKGNDMSRIELNAQLAKQKISEITDLEVEIGYYIAWKMFLKKTDTFQSEWIELLYNHPAEDWLKILEDAWLYYNLLDQDQNDKFPTDDSTLRVLKDLGIKIQKNQEILIKHNLDDWFNSGQKRIKQKGLQVNQLFNLRGSKGTSRNSLRKIIQTDLEAFTDFFPLLMFNPSTCSSVLPLQKDFFDLVIFDEASQLRIEETFTALLRGKQVIVSGDSQQMPPSSYFGSAAQILDDESEFDDDISEDESGNIKLIDDASKEMATKESLLEFAIDAGYTETYLDMHYRSKHPDLIEFSNVCFYGGRLVPMPEKSSELPIEYVHVNGLYESQQNRKEAEEIIKLLKNGINSNFSVGIATFNLTQRNLILTLISNERVSDKEFHSKMTLFEQNGFFVKNLENIQGDEKDVIIISTTFGVKADGKFLMNFGPLGKQNGHRLFNVIITRAKIKVFLVTSIPEQKIPEYRERLELYRKVDGRTALMAYLDYSKAVSNNNEQGKAEILQFIKSKISLGQSNLTGASTGLTESPFEEEVYAWLAEAIGVERVKLQYKCGGFRIDMVVFPKDKTSNVKLAIECDGAAYHSDQLSWHYDIYRQDQLEKENFIFHRIWSTNWWRKPEKEFESLLDVINSLN